MAPQLEVLSSPRSCPASDSLPARPKLVRFSSIKVTFAIPRYDDPQLSRELFWSADEMSRFRIEALEDITDIAHSLNVSVVEAQYILQQPDCTLMRPAVRPVWPQIDRKVNPRPKNEKVSLLEYFCEGDCFSCEHDCFLGIPLNW